jgi:hypothetical protein
VFEGKPIVSIALDFDRLNGRALRQAEKRFQSAGDIAPMQGAVWSDSYCACCAAQICGWPLEAIESLSGQDYLEVAMLVRGFLLALVMPAEATPARTSASS